VKTEAPTSPYTEPDDRDLRSNKYFVLSILGLINLFNYMDRNLFSILLEQIKADLQFTDSQLGVLGGFSFALCYAVFGIILGRVADKKNRVYLLSIALGIWSLASAACGLAKSFLEFFMARVGVGIGEAGCVPSAHSIIGDYFPPKERALAVSVFTGIGTIGSIVGIVVGGALAEAYGWRSVFLIFGLPGVALALVVVFLIKEPSRAQFETGLSTHSDTFSQSATKLLSKRTVQLLLLGIPLFYFIIGGAGIWIPSFYVRVHGVSIAEFGRTGGIALGAGYLIGTLAGGVIANKLININRLWEFWLPALAAFVSIPIYWAAFSLDDTSMSYYCLFIASLIAGSGMGASMSSLQVVTESNMRATAVGFMLLATSLIAYGCGPLFVGVGSDLLIESGLAANDGVSLGYALKLSLIAPLLASILFLLASKTAAIDAVN